MKKRQRKKNKKKAEREWKEFERMWVANIFSKSCLQTLRERDPDNLGPYYSNWVVVPFKLSPEEKKDG